MSDRKKMNVKFVKAENGTPIHKAVSSTNVEDTKEAELSGVEGVIPRPYDMKALQQIIDESTILQQCIEAYRRNIVGFGATPAYIDDEVVGEESPEMKQEWARIEQFVQYFNFDKSFEDIWGTTIEDRETTGNGYIEVIRDGKGLPSGGERLDPAYMYVTKLTDKVDIEQSINGERVKRPKRFRRYVQDVGTKKVYYKEFGDPRKMDYRTGEFVENIEEQYEANEIIHIKIGSKAYGIPRWIGQLIHIAGARKAEELNYNYFYQGRHTPMAILLHNAELSPESEEQLVNYAKSVEGTDNAHKFLVIEAEGLAEGMLEEEKTNAKVEMKSLAEMLQQDALFLEYDEASRQKVQSSFRLPDIYVGRSTDFNRATADTARYITEEQVFEPERNSLEWIINRKFLNDYEIQHIKLNFKKPEISNSEEVVKVIDVANKAGAIAPNDIRDIIGKYLGKELEPFEGEQYDVPTGALQAEAQLEGLRQDVESNQSNTQSTPSVEKENEQIEKAYSQDELVMLMKDMRDVLLELSADDKD